MMSVPPCNGDACFSRAAHRVHDERTSTVNSSNARRGISPEQRDRRNALVQTHVKKIVRLFGEDEVDAKGFAREPARLSNQVAQLVRLPRRARKHAKTSGVRHCRSELGAGPRTDRRLNNRHVDSEQSA